MKTANSMKTDDLHNRKHIKHNAIKKRTNIFRNNCERNIEVELNWELSNVWIRARREIRAFPFRLIGEPFSDICPLIIPPHPISNFRCSVAGNAGDTDDVSGEDEGLHLRRA